MKFLNSVSIDGLRSNLKDIMGLVVYGRQKVVINKHNKPSAVLISLDEYERLSNPASRFTEQEWKAKFQFFKDIQERNQDLSEEEVSAAIEQAIREVRAERKLKKK